MGSRSGVVVANELPSSDKSEIQVNNSQQRQALGRAAAQKIIVLDLTVNGHDFWRTIEVQAGRRATWKAFPHLE